MADHKACDLPIRGAGTLVLLLALLLGVTFLCVACRPASTRPTVAGPSRDIVVSKLRAAPAELVRSEALRATLSLHWSLLSVDFRMRLASRRIVRGVGSAIIVLTRCVLVAVTNE